MEIYWTNDNRRWYRTIYLHSEHWKELRKRKLTENPICEKCKIAHAVEPHHLRYRNIFDVELLDLLSVCRKCHEEIHSTQEMPRRKKPRFGKMSDEQRAAINAHNETIFAANRERKKLRKEAQKKGQEFTEIQPPRKIWNPKRGQYMW